MKELFPAEWLPISITVIFFLGGSNFTPTDSAIEISPEEGNKHELHEWISKKQTIPFSLISTLEQIRLQTQKTKKLQCR